MASLGNEIEALRNTDFGRAFPEGIQRIQAILHKLAYQCASVEAEQCYNDEDESYLRDVAGGQGVEDINIVHFVSRQRQPREGLRQRALYLQGGADGGGGDILDVLRHLAPPEMQPRPHSAGGTAVSEPPPMAPPEAGGDQQPAKKQASAQSLDAPAPAPEMQSLVTNSGISDDNTDDDTDDDVTVNTDDDTDDETLGLVPAKPERSARRC